MKKTIIVTLKIILTALLCFYLSYQGMIDWSKLALLIESPTLLGLLLLISLVGIFFNTLRFKTILEGQIAMKTKFKSIFIPNWSGYFFNIILPGAISGDLIKLYVIRRDTPGLKTSRLILSVLMDRSMGLLSFSLLSVFFCIQFFNQSPTVSTIYYFTLTISVTMLAVIFLSSFLVKLKLPRFIIVLLTQVKVLRRNFLKTLTYALLSQFALVTLIYFITQQLNPTSSFAKVIGTGAMGMISTALPFTPGGAGVSHFAFQKLFEIQKIQRGADIFNIYYFFQIFFYGIGFILQLAFFKISIRQIQKS